MPVRFRKISADFKTFVSECRENLFGDVCFWIFRKGGVRRCDFIVRLFRIKHSKAVVVFRGENHVFHSGGFCSISPFFWIEVKWIEGFLEMFVIFYIVIISFSMFGITLCPTLVFGTETPAFYNTPLAVCSPMHKEAEFKILPGFEILHHLWVCRFLVARGYVVFLGFRNKGCCRN